MIIGRSIYVTLPIRGTIDIKGKVLAVTSQMGNDNHSCLAKWPLNNNNKSPVRQELNSWANLPCVVLHDIFLLLDQKDLLSASSTCQNWRQALYHPRFWNKVTFTLVPSFTVQRSQFLASACGHLVKNATIRYDSLSTPCIYDLCQLFRCLTKNHNIKTLLLEPSHCKIQEKDNDYVICFLLESILKICPRLEKFSAGCSEKLCDSSPQFLESIVQGPHPENVEMLAFASVKDDPGHYMIVDVDNSMFSVFTRLKVLSVDYDYVSDELLISLSNTRSLTRLIVHVHGLWEDHPGTTEKAWQTFKTEHPDCELRLTLIHAYEAVHNLQEKILHPSMPLSHLKVFFCEELNIDILHLVSSWYTDTLRSIIWVNSRNSSSLWSFIELAQSNIPDPLVMAAWICLKLEEIVLLGFKYFEHDLIAIARLRCDVLKKIVVIDEDIILSDKKDIHDSRKELSNVLGYDWAPVPIETIHPVIKHQNAGDSDDFLLPYVLADLH